MNFDQFRKRSTSCDSLIMHKAELKCIKRQRSASSPSPAAPCASAGRGSPRRDGSGSAGTGGSRTPASASARQAGETEALAAGSLKLTSRYKEMDIIENLNKEKKRHCTSLLTNDNSESIVERHHYVEHRAVN